MTKLVRIIDKNGVVSNIALKGPGLHKVKAGKGDKVTVVDEQTGAVVENVIVRDAGSEIELTFSQDGQQFVVQLADGDGNGIGVLSGAGNEVEAGKLYAGDFLISDEGGDSSGYLMAGLGALALGGAIALLKDEKDTTPPVIGKLDMTDGTDFGANKSDNLTNNGHPVLTFSGEPGLRIALEGPDGKVLSPSQYSVAFDATTKTYTVTLLDADPNSEGAQPFGTIENRVDSGNPASSDDGTYTIIASDAAGNTADVGTFEIDTTAPVAPVITDVTEVKGDPDGTDLISNDNTQVLTVIGEIGATLKVYTSTGTPIDASQYKVTEDKGTYTVNFDTNTLLDGDYVVTLTDAAGNESDNSSTFTIDMTAPVLGALDMTNLTDSGANKDDEVTSNGNPVLTFAGEAGLDITLTGANDTLLDPTQYTVKYDPDTKTYTRVVLVWN